ncbi:MAG: cytochrome c oxidase subunit II [Tepidiformaceae bacterium]
MTLEWEEFREMHMLARHWPVRKALALVSASLLAFLSIDVALAQSGQAPGITDEAREMHELYIIVLILALLVFFAVEAALVFMLFRFRRRNDELPPQTHGNNLLEIIWTAIPIVIVLILFVFSFITLIDVEDTADEEALTIEVQGFQFSWQFTYNLNDLGANSDENSKDTVVIIGLAGEENEPTLYIPVNEPVEFRLASDDVIHSFYVRDFLYKLDVIPGRDNKFMVTARETGTFEGQCAELCGLNHAFMRFRVEVMTREAFDRWVAGQPKRPAAAAAAVGGR